jgi:hypothetical protein
MEAGRMSAYIVGDFEVHPTERVLATNMRSIVQASWLAE